jgi:hypothetical protein
MVGLCAAVNEIYHTHTYPFVSQIIFKLSGKLQDCYIATQWYCWYLKLFEATGEKYHFIKSYHCDKPHVTLSLTSLTQDFRMPSIVFKRPIMFTTLRIKCRFSKL